MAKALVWRDLDEMQVLTILEECNSSESIKQRLQNFMKIEDTGDRRSEILLDMYLHAFLFTQDNRFTAKKTSAFISILKNTHTQAVGDSLTSERSWERTKDLLLLHSVQRPPFSVQIFSWADLKAMTDYFLNTYYRHYKLYQYCFCPTLILNLETYKDDIEIAPAIPPLSDAISQQQWDVEQEALQRQEEEEELKRLAEQALVEEATRKASIEAAFRNAVPEEVAQKTKLLVDFYLEQMKTELVGMLQEQEKMVEDKLESLQSRAKGK